MNLFDRLNELLAFDLETGFREREPTEADVRRDASCAIAAERCLARAVEQARAEIGRWEARADAALAAGRDDLARRAHLRRGELEGCLVELEGGHAAARQVRDVALDDLAALDARLESEALYRLARAE
jgi:phage shock protein A